jgi:hypothetical protein
VVDSDDESRQPGGVEWEGKKGGRGRGVGDL